jgi:hypothetical protein
VKSFVEGDARDRIEAQADEVRPPHAAGEDAAEARDLTLFRPPQ